MMPEPSADGHRSTEPLWTTGAKRRPRTVQDRDQPADAVPVTSVKPYRGRHAAPDDAVEQPGTAEPEPAAPVATPIADTQRAEPQPPARPAAPWSAFAGQAPLPPVVAQAPNAAPQSDWVAYTPPPAPAVVGGLGEAQPPIWEPPVDVAVPDPDVPKPIWEMPAGFVPLQPPRAKSPAPKYIAVLAAVAVLSGLGWFGYQTFAHTTPVPAPAAVIPAAAVDFTSAGGHFKVGLPAQAVTSTYQQTFGATKLAAAAAAVPGAHVAAVGFVVTPGIPADALDAFMHGVIDGFGQNGSISNLTTTTYDGRPAITATKTTSDNVSERVLVFAYSSTRMYLLVAPDDASLTALESHFTPTP